jgi:cytochrome c556
MNKTNFYATALFAFGVACSAPAFSQTKPDVLVKQRQAAMVLQGKYFGPLNLMAQGKIPYDQKVVVRNAGYLDVLSRLAWDGFAPSTKGEKSATLPAVFSDTAKFNQVADQFQAESSKLVQVSKGSDEASVKNQIQAVGKTCAACHDDFREKR